MRPRPSVLKDKCHTDANFPVTSPFAWGPCLGWLGSKTTGVPLFIPPSSRQPRGTPSPFQDPPTKVYGCIPVGSDLWLSSKLLRASLLTPGHLESKDWGDSLNELGCFLGGGSRQSFFLLQATQSGLLSPCSQHWVRPHPGLLHLPRSPFHSEGDWTTLEQALGQALWQGAGS